MPPENPPLKVKDDIRAAVDRVNQAGGSYHRFRLADDLEIEGDYDLSKYIDRYAIPARLDGLSVLDVGTSSGFLAVECARRGAAVTAIDLWETSWVMQAACAALGVEVRYLKKSVFDLDPAFGQFDLVICGSMLLHVRSPLDAIHRIRAVCRGRAIISTTCTGDSEYNDRPLCEFTGIHASDGDYWHYWTISAVALKTMMLASGFSSIDHVDHFILQTEAGRIAHSSLHVVVSATI